ncbi:MAG: hypothetical protein V7L21_22075 [Nostoc sp.]|uniref:hypothetical protein n=1 Tax=Nostoc sp. TaxID=1180 RepID=UPI002FFC3F28|nr:hypothetical protein [Nostoc sp. NMS9]
MINRAELISVGVAHRTRTGKQATRWRSLCLRHAIRVRREVSPRVGIAPDSFLP